MNQSRICSLCGFENPANASLCGRCQAPLSMLLPSRITERVPEPESIYTSERKQYLGHLPRNVIGILISSREEPVLVQVKDEMLLGRNDPAIKALMFDLTPYGGVLLGVSRQHALIKRTETGYAVKDLGSTNGSWINGERLKPNQFHDLLNGDQLRLAQLTLTIFTSMGERVVEDHFCLQGSTADLSLTPDHLMTIIGPYLRALTGLQLLIDEMKGRKPASVFVRSISSESLGVCVTMTGITEALGIARTLVIEERKQQRAPNTTRKISAENLAEFEVQIAPPVLESLPPTPEQDKLVAELAAQVIKQVAPNLDTEGIDRKAFITRLLPSLRQLVFSPVATMRELKT